MNSATMLKSPIRSGKTIIEYNGSALTGMMAKYEEVDMFPHMDDYPE